MYVQVYIHVCNILMEHTHVRFKSRVQGFSQPHTLTPAHAHTIISDVCTGRYTYRYRQVHVQVQAGTHTGTGRYTYRYRQVLIQVQAGTHAGTGRYMYMCLPNISQTAGHSHLSPSLRTDNPSIIKITFVTQYHLLNICSSIL